MLRVWIDLRAPAVVRKEVSHDLSLLFRDSLEEPAEVPVGLPDGLPVVRQESGCGLRVICAIIAQETETG